MISLFNYIEKYGDFSFTEKEFNEVDNAIFSALTYINFSDIVPSKKNCYKSLKDAALEFFAKYSKKELANNILAIKEAIKLFDKIKDFKRYQDVLLYNYVSKKDDAKQFSAMCIKVSKNLIYVSYEGTDELISGWKEDFELAYKFPVPAHIEAINYLNKSIKLSTKNVIVGGHSKGGNLALVASMYTKFWIRNKIVKIYSNDGPGLLQEELKSKKLQKVIHKYVHIIPNYSIVGQILHHPENNRIIQSNKKGILAHDFLTWQVENDHFVLSKLSNSSIKFKNITDKWLQEYTKEAKQNFIKELFDIFKRENVASLLDIKSQKISGIIGLIKESKKLDSQSKKMFKDFLTLIIEDYSSSTKQTIKNTITESKNMFKKL